MREFKFTFVARVSVVEKTLSLIWSTHDIRTQYSIVSLEIPVYTVVNFMSAFLNDIFEDAPHFKLCPQYSGSATFVTRFG